MQNIKSHKVNIPPATAKICWDILVKKYLTIEHSLAQKPEDKFYHNYIHITGAFMMSLEKYNELPKTELKSFFDKKRQENDLFHLKTRIIFRGPTYYIGYSEKGNEEKLISIKDRVMEILDLAKEINADDNLVLYLSLLDNLKNYLFITLFAVNQLTKEKGYRSSFLDTRDYVKFLSLIRKVENAFVGSLSDKSINLIVEPSLYKQVISLIFRYLLRDLPYAEKNSRLRKEIIRKVREMDHPLKLLYFAKKVCSQYLPSDCLLIGIEYGGIELPFFINSYRKKIDKKRLDFITLNMSNYSSNNKICVNNFEEAISPYNSKRIFRKTKHILILDDSTTTGRTINNLIEILPSNIEEIYLGLVAFKISNRYHHVIRGNHGSINPMILKMAILGFQSQYSTTYTIKSYTNRHGTFDINKKRIQKLLERTHEGIYL